MSFDRTCQLTTEKKEKNREKETRRNRVARLKAIVAGDLSCRLITQHGSSVGATFFAGFRCHDDFSR